MYLLFLSSNKIPPFMYWLCKVYRVHGDLDLADDVMFTKTVKIKHLQHQSLTSQLSIWYLERDRMEKLTPTWFRPCEDNLMIMLNSLKMVLMI